MASGDVFVFKKLVMQIYITSLFHSYGVEIAHDLILVDR